MTSYLFVWVIDVNGYQGKIQKLHWVKKLFLRGIIGVSGFT